HAPTRGRGWRARLRPERRAFWLGRHPAVDAGLYRVARLSIPPGGRAEGARAERGVARHASDRGNAERARALRAGLRKRRIRERIRAAARGIEARVGGARATRQPTAGPGAAR